MWFGKRFAYVLLRQKEKINKKYLTEVSIEPGTSRFE